MFSTYIAAFLVCVGLIYGQHEDGSDMKSRDQYEQVSDYVKNYLGECDPKDGEMRVAHQTCLSNWRNLLKTGKVADLVKQCPTFCDYVEDGCVWKIACRRCENLAMLCSKSVPMCEAYIASNRPKTDAERCPQFELCFPADGHMEAIRTACETIYIGWRAQYDQGKSFSELEDPCDLFCRNVKEDCSWRISCKKCTLLMKLTRTARTEAFTHQFEIKMNQENGQRCAHYKNSRTFPYWWVTGNWF